MDDIEQYLNSISRHLRDDIDEQIRLILLDTGNKAVEKINKFINDWYGDYTPKNYQRTDCLRNCARFSITGKHSIKVYMDMRRLKSSTENNGKGWQAHRGFNGEDFTYGLIDFLENGGKGVGSTHNPRRYDFGIQFLAQTQKFIDDYIAEQVDTRIKAFIKTNYVQK